MKKRFPVISGNQPKKNGKIKIITPSNPAIFFVMFADTSGYNKELFNISLLYSIKYAINCFFVCKYDNGSINAVVLISVCKDCEFRYICIDCRIFLKNKKQTPLLCDARRNTLNLSGLHTWFGGGHLYSVHTFKGEISKNKCCTCICFYKGYGL